MASSFTQAFLAGSQAGAALQNSLQNQLSALINRRPSGGYGGAVRSVGGGDPLSRIRAIEQQRAEEERRQQLHKQQMEQGQAQTEQMQLQNQAIQKQFGVDAPGVFRNYGPSDTEAWMERYQDVQAVQDIPRQAEMDILRGQVEESQLRAQAQAGTMTEEQLQREQARQKGIAAYANKDAETMNQIWGNIFPGVKNVPKFKNDPSGNLLVQWKPDSPWEVFDHGDFRQTLIYGANPALESSAGTTAVPGSAGAGAGGGMAAGGGGLDTSGLKSPTWKQFMDVVKDQGAQEMNKVDLARKYADSKVPPETRVNMKGETKPEEEKKWQEAFKEGLQFAGSNTGLRSLGVSSPNEGRTLTQIRQLSDEASKQWEKWVKDGRNPDPNAYYQKLNQEFGPKVALRWAQKHYQDFINTPPQPPEQPAETPGVYQGYGQTVYRGRAQDAIPAQPTTPAVPPGQVQRQQEQGGKPIVAKSGSPLTLPGGEQLVSMKDNRGNLRIGAIGPDGTPMPLNEEQQRALAEMANQAPPEDKPMLNAILMNLLRQAKKAGPGRIGQWIRERRAGESGGERILGARG